MLELGKLDEAPAAENRSRLCCQILVTPKYQGRSLGRKLLAFTRTQLPDEIQLRCAEGNVKAWRWYEREGFL